MSSTDFSAFDIEGLTIEEIPIDDEAESRRYMIKMYERIRRLEKPTAKILSEEAIESNGESSTSTCLTFSDDSFDEEIPDALQVKDFVQVDAQGNHLIVPIFKTAEDIQKWMRVVEHHESRLMKIIAKLKKVQDVSEIQEKFENARKEIFDKKFKRLKDKSKIEAIKRTLFISFAENEIISKIGSIGLKFQNISCKTDGATDGLWAQSQPHNSATDKMLQNIGTKRIVLTRRFKFNSRQTDWLIKILFSSRHDVIAKAKLDLLSQIDDSMVQDVIDKPSKVLEIVCAEARLTQNEILYLVFPKDEKSDNRQCLSCNTAILIAEVVYHKQCKTIKWLAQSARFSYAEVEKCLRPSEMTYLSPATKANLNEILRIHALFKRDIVHSTATEDVIWKRRDDGRLEQVKVRSERESNIVGTVAWRREHGLI